MADTKVGSVSYDVKINVDNVKKQAAEVDKIVKDMYKNMEKSGKSSKASVSAPKSSSSTPGSAPSSAVSKAIADTKASAQASLDAISQYSPKIQAQFIAVERANMRVTAATNASANAITKYGVDSTQAESATNRLSSALTSQSQAQARLEASISKTTGMQSVFNKETLSVLGSLAKISAIAGTAVVGGFTAAGMAAFNQVKQVENASFALRAYEKDGAAVNTVLSQLVEFAQSDMGTLFQREELFQAAANLKGFGEATGNLNERVQVLAKGVALGMTDFNELSQIMGRAANAGRLSTVAYDQLANKMIILDPALRGAKVSAEDLFQALDDAIDDSVLEGRASTIEGQMIRLQSAFRNLGGVILGVDTQTSQFIEGGLGAAIVKLIGDTTSFINENQRMITSLGTGIIVFATLAGGAFAVVKAIMAIRTAVIALSIAARWGLGIFGLLAAAIAAVAGIALGKMATDLQDSSESAESLKDNLETVPTYAGNSADEIGKMAKQMKSLNDQMDKVRSNFREQLAELVASKNENIATLRQTLAEEEAAYATSYAKRMTTFKKSEFDEQVEHSKKVRALQSQIDFLQRYNNAYNAQKLSELKFALARENSEFTKQTQLRQDEFNLETEAAATEYEKRRAENEIKLNAELALLEKHREDVLSVRNVILLDEIEKLKRSEREQLKSLERQKQDALSNADSMKTELGDAGSSIGKSMGDNMAKSLMDGLKEGLKNTWNSFWNGLRDSFNNWRKSLHNDVEMLKAGYDPKTGLPKSKSAYRTDSHGNITWDPYKKRAGGGPVSAGTPYWVGDNPDGTLNKTSELFIPSTSGTIISARDSQALLSKAGSGGDTFHINISGVFATSATEQRKIADVIAARLKETQKAKGYA